MESVLPLNRGIERTYTSLALVLPRFGPSTTPATFLNKRKEEPGLGKNPIPRAGVFGFNTPHPRSRTLLVRGTVEDYNRLSYKLLRSKGTVLRADGKEAA